MEIFHETRAKRDSPPLNGTFCGENEIIGKMDRIPERVAIDVGNTRGSQLLIPFSIFSGVEYVLVFLAESISVQDANWGESKASRARPSEEDPV